MNKLPSTSASPPQLPQQSSELFRQIFAPTPMLQAAEPEPPVLAEAGAYENYVRALEHYLKDESRRLVETTEDLHTLVRFGHELFQAEMGRRGALQPYLIAGQAAVAPAWAMLRGRLQENMVRELEAIRDARLCLEMRKADLINRQSGRHTRIVLQGGGQITLHFRNRAARATKKD